MSRQFLQPPLPAVVRAKMGSLADRSDPDGGRVLAEADSLGIPWRAILLQEVLAERTLRAYLGDLQTPWTLREAIWLLPNSLLHSWRIRSRIHRLALGLLAGSDARNRRELSLVVRHLSNGHEDASPQSIRAHQLWFAYQRILALLRVRRAAAKSRGAFACIDSIRSRTKCSAEEADWGLRCARSPERGAALEDCVRRAREEGFDIPPAETEFQAFLLVRRIVKKIWNGKRAG